VLRQYTGPSMQEGEARHYTSFEERQGVVVFKFGSTAYDTTSEGRQFFLVDSHHTQVEVAPVSWSPQDLGFRRPQWERKRGLTRPSLGSG
jgi:hypothetical protein